MKRKLRWKRVSRSTVVWMAWFTALLVLIWTIQGTPLGVQITVSILYPYSVFLTWTTYYKEEV